MVQHYNLLATVGMRRSTLVFANVADSRPCLHLQSHPCHLRKDWNAHRAEKNKITCMLYASHLETHILCYSKLTECCIEPQTSPKSKVC